MLREERRGDGEASRGRQGETAHRGGRNGVVDGGRLWRRAEELVGRIVVLRGCNVGRSQVVQMVR
jgi:hypothetical protein